LASSSPNPFARNDKDRVEDQPETEPDNRTSLGVVVTGYHLLNILVVVAFGAWKVITIGNEGWVFLSKTEFALIPFAGVLYAFYSYFLFPRFAWGTPVVFLERLTDDGILRIYYLRLQLLKEASPNIRSGFFEIDLAPPIWNFVYRSEGERGTASCDHCAMVEVISLLTVWSMAVYLFLLSLLPLQPAVAKLLSALDTRQWLQPGNQSPTFAAPNVLITAIMGIIFSILAITQQLAKVFRLRGEQLLGSAACPTEALWSSVQCGRYMN
jgi:hypothetical protein